MKVILLSTFDRNGGAAIACIRMAKALLEYGMEVKVLSMIKKGKESFIHEVEPCRKYINPLLRHGQYALDKRVNITPGFQFSGNPWLGNDVSKHPAVVEADIIQLHWINQGFMGTHELEKLFLLKKPIAWHMHDMWPFTGGCHYSGKCQNFQFQCGNCPALRKPFSFDKSYEIWFSKFKSFNVNSPVLVGASKWLSEMANMSSLGQICNIAHIPNPISPNEYFPGNKNYARQLLGLKSEKKALLFAAMNTEDPRKGFRELTRSLEIVKNTGPEIELYIGGKASSELMEKLPLPAHRLGSLSSEKMRLAYQASDLFVIPSLEENLPNTIMESMACGTPIAGFRTGGIPEMVDEGQNGFLANTGDIQQLAESILNTISHPKPEFLSMNAINKVNKTYLPELVANNYANLFNDLLSGSTTFQGWINK